MAPVLAAADAGDCLPLIPNSLLNAFVDGTIAIRASHGVAQTLRISLSGSRALVMAYAVANLEKSTIQSTQRLYVLYHDPNSTLTEAPISVPSGHTLLTQPSFPPEIFAKFFHTSTHPLAFADIRR
ncbi:MAG: hypothetical protein Q9170_003374 [Blastenia crenularia]